MREAIAQLAARLDLKMEVLRAEDVKVTRPEAKGVVVSQIIREMREAV